MSKVLRTDCDADRVAPVSIMSFYVEAIEATGLSTADSTPSVFASVADSRILERGKRDSGTSLVVSIKYNDDVTAVSQQPKIGVFGWTVNQDGTIEDGPRLLVSRNGNVFEEVTMNADDDASDGGFKYSSPNLEEQCWDTAACNRFKFVCETEATGTGTFTDATLEAKIL